MNRTTSAWHRWLLPFVALGFACSFTRFSDLAEDTPAVSLSVPDGFRNTGRVVSAVRTDQSTWLFAGASQNYALYDLGTDEKPSEDASNRVACRIDEGCWLARHATPLVRESESDTLGCFVYGMSVDDQNRTALQVTCHDETRITIPVPSEVGTVAVKTRRDADALTIELAGSRDGIDSALLAALPDSSLVFWYPSGSTSPRLLQNPVEADSGFGEALAVLRTDEHPLGVIGDLSDEDHGRLWIIDLPETGTASVLGCVEGDEGFGRTLTSGRFTDPDLDDLAVSSDERVTIVPQAALLEALSASTPDCADLADIDAAFSAGCKAQDDWSGCDQARFGEALAAANVDGDDYDELLVGAPGADVRGENAAGVVLAYRTSDQELELGESLFISSAESSDQLGSALVGVELDRPDVIATGAPGGNKLALFFCSSFLRADDRGSRCE